MDDAVRVQPKKINYLNNKDMLKEIHKSKNSYCEFTDTKYEDYDIIVERKEDIFLSESQSSVLVDGVEEVCTVLSTFQKAQAQRASRLAVQARDTAQSLTEEKVKLSTYKIDPQTIPLSDLVFRVYTYEHIDKEPGRKKTPKRTADEHSKLPFIPYKHYILTEDFTDLIEVGKSHSKNGKFSPNHGSITNKLAKMFMLLVHKYSQRSNWRSYTYLDEMRGQSLLQLIQMGLRFDEFKSDNPFSYFTALVNNSFTRVLNIEKKNQGIRDDLLIAAGANPSFTRQLAIEEEIRKLREDAQHSQDTE